MAILAPFCVRLSHITLSSSGMRSDGLISLCAALAKSERLRCLNISRNQIGDRGGKSLASLLKKSLTLETVDCDDNL